jgi:hypothetical protein
MRKSPCRSCGYPQQSLGSDASDASVLAAWAGAEEELDASDAAAGAAAGAAAEGDGDGDGDGGDGGVAAAPRAAG